MCKYSIIVPVYNAESTLTRCVDSLLNQNCKDAEIILINDGSSDKSGELCERYAQASKQVKYIFQKNGGVSAARNSGLAVAAGDYILFVDSDDSVTDDFFQQLDCILEKDNADLTIFAQYYCKSGNRRIINRQEFFSNHDGDLYSRVGDLMCKKIISDPLAKAYRREIIQTHNILFPRDVSIGEDRAFNIKYTLFIETLRVVNVPIYFISLDNETSLSRGKRENFAEQSDVIKHYINAALEQCSLSSDDKKYILDALNFGEYRTVYTYAKMFWKNGDNRGMRCRKIKHLCQEMNSQHFSLPRTRYCRLIIFPVYFELVGLIDFIAWKLTH